MSKLVSSHMARMRERELTKREPRPDRAAVYQDLYEIWRERTAALDSISL